MYKFSSIRIFEVRNFENLVQILFWPDLSTYNWLHFSNEAIQP